MDKPQLHRYRLTFGKGYAIKYVAHLDMVLGWTRAFRRCNIPLAYTGGFNPQAKIQVALSLPVGYMGSAELMDIYLTEAMNPADILERVSAALPSGFELHAVEVVALKGQALQSQLRRANYTVTVESKLPKTALKNRLETILAAEELMQTRIRRQREEYYDMRPLVHTLELANWAGDEAILKMQLSAGQHGNLRPDAVLKTIGLSDEWFQVERAKLFFAFDS